MENDQTNSEPIVSSQDAAPGTITKIFKVFYEPTAVFKSLTSSTAWLVPFFIIAIIVGTMGYFTRPIMADAQMKGVMKNIEGYKDQMPPQQYEELVNRVEGQFEDAMANKFEWYYPLVILGIIALFLAIITLIGWLTGNFIFGGKAGFWLVLNAVAYAALVGLLGDIIRDSLVLSKGTMDVYIGLGLLKSAVGGDSFLFYLFRQIDIFSIWRIVVTCIGLGVVFNMKSQKFGYVIFPIWLVFIALVAIANTFAGGTIIY